MKNELVSRLTIFANTAWNGKQINHAHMGIFDDYPCANPDGPVDNSDCPEEDPLCNCPCQELKPNSPEPTKEEIETAKEDVSECERIQQYLGPEWMGCMWNNLEHPSSCNCPCVGSKFKDYVEYSRTYSTYWDTDPQQPLWREAQMMLLKSQAAVMTLSGDLTLRPGQMVHIISTTPTDEQIPRRSSGRWMVVSIQHEIEAATHMMQVYLMRDSAVINPNDDKTISPKDFFEDLFGLFT